MISTKHLSESKIMTNIYKKMPNYDMGCPDCGLQYCPESKSDRAIHRKFHKYVAGPDEPKPDDSLAKNRDPKTGIVWLDGHISNHHNLLLWGVGKRFRREMGYDMAPWPRTKNLISNDQVGFVFVTNIGGVYGGGSFEKYSNYIHSGQLALSWIWISPNYRREGALRKAFPAFEQRFFRTLIAPPISPPMKAFLLQTGRKPDKLGQYWI